jgi:nucleotide-binding universal stress UspA family protein
VSSAFSKILVPIDDSDPARAAAETALRVARECGSEIVFAHALDARVIVDLGELVKDRAAALLAREREKAEARGLKSSAEILVGGLVKTLTEFAGETGADLIVMGTHARKGLSHLVLGSAAEGVLRASSVPVIVVRSAPQGGADDEPTFARILVALDDSGSGGAALSVALRYAATIGAELWCCTIVESEGVLRNAAVYGFDPKPIVRRLHTTAEKIVERALERARSRGIAAQGLVREDVAVVDGIIEAARDQDATLIAVGTHGKSGPGYFVLGSVAEGVVRNSPIPVLAVRAGAEREEV